MQFNSIEFLLFFPIVFALYWSLRSYLRLQNWFIILCSYFFYGLWDVQLLYLVILTSFLSWGAGLLIERYRTYDRAFLLLSILLNLGILCLFKYYDFFVSSLVDTLSVFGISVYLSSLQLIVPVGISFYTFQALSYTIDVYRRTILPTREVGAFFAYICFFPQLVAGPIERAGNLLGQFLVPRQFDFDRAADGIRQILWGFFLKVVLADNCASVANVVFDHAEEMSWHGMLIGILFFTFQIYGDFAGYSHIAIGCARMLGFSLMDNFQSPYLSRNIREFWRRWHISLNTWFRDYVYIPLGGNQQGWIVRSRNVLLTFMLSGLWHGANWTYVLWGCYNGCLVLLSGRRTSRSFPSWLQIPFTFLLVMIGWTVFRAQTVQQAFTILLRIILFRDGASVLSFDLVSDVVFSLCFVLMAAIMFIDFFSRDYHHPLQPITHYSIAVRWSVYLVLSFMTVFFVGQPTPFIYFQF